MNDISPSAVALARGLTDIDTPPALIEALPLAAYACDAKGRVRWFNAKAAEVWGREPAIGDHAELFCGSYRLWTLDGRSLGRGQTPMAHVLATGVAIAGVEAVVERPDGSRITAMVHIEPIKDRDGRMVGAINCFHDTSASHQNGEAESRRRADLVSELNHRLKNNMQILQSLLSAAGREAETEEGRELLSDASRRIAAIAAAQSSIGEGDRFKVGTLIDSLGRYASQIWTRQADVSASAADGEIPNEFGIPLALIVNELVSNAVKHAKSGDAHVEIEIRLDRDGGDWLLSVTDNGPGFTYEESKRRASGLGLVAGLARQLGGTFAVTCSSGARCELRFPSR